MEHVKLDPPLTPEIEFLALDHVSQWIQMHKIFGSKQKFIGLQFSVLSRSEVLNS